MKRTPNTITKTQRKMKYQKRKTKKYKKRRNAKKNKILKEKHKET
jgi:hypothetical protein